MGVIIYNLFSRHFTISAIYICATLPCRSGPDSVNIKVIVSEWISEIDTLIPGRTVSEEEAVILSSLTRKMC